MFEIYAQDYRITIQEIPLGNQGEDMARCLVIDITDAVNEFGSGGTVSVRNKRNGDELPYFCTNVSTVTGADAEGNVHTYIKWTLTDVDTAAAGSGFVQADYIISGVTVKTWVYKYFILPSLGITGDVPDPYEDILEEIEAQVSAVQTAAASAAASAAQASAEATRIITTTESVVEDWLSDHIVTGYTVDDTLTISGAAADAEKAGDMIRAAFVTEQTSGSIASFADGADGVPLKDLVVNISPVQSGTGDPSPTNARAISGWTGANVTRCGKNLWDAQGIVEASNHPIYCYISDGYLRFHTGSPTSNGLHWDNLRFPCPLTFTATAKNFESSSNNSISMMFVFDDGTYQMSGWGSLSPGESSTLSFTVGTAGKTVVKINNTWTSTKQAGLLIADTQLEVGSASEFEPFTKNVYNVSFGSSAGTVYGGTLDVTSGMLTVTWNAWNMGRFTYNYNADGAYFYSAIGDKAPGNHNIISSIYKTTSATSVTQMSDYEIKGHPSSYTIYIKDSRYTDGASLKAALEGQMFACEISNPVSYQLTPTEVKSLLANNNIFADTGSVASCEYRADTKLYIEHLTDPDSDMIANANITSGSYFMVNNNLYLATSAIAAGATIIPGTNCTATNLAAALNAINS